MVEAINPITKKTLKIELRMLAAMGTCFAVTRPRQHWYPVVSYPWTFCTQTIRTQGQMFRTHFRSVRTQPSGRFVPNKLSQSFRSF